jgi:hypothetical protein
VDAEGGHWVRFVFASVPASPEKPPGIGLIADTARAGGERLVGFDKRPSSGAAEAQRAPEPSPPAGSTTLLADFWETVDAVLRERGVIPWGAFERRPQPCETIRALRAASACKVSPVSTRSAGSPVAAS